VPDVFTSDKRSRVMSAIRAKHTRPEMVVRQMLHLLGYRFRLHAANLPGKPDIVIPRIRTIVQVKGCFWHGHSCLKGRIPVGNRPYWEAKIAGNKLRDRRNEQKLRRAGWKVKTIWECTIRASSATTLYARLLRTLATEHNQNANAHSRKLARLEASLRAIRNR
jgi:DNA mismatch endonuclease (patch repair protein)